MADDIEQPVLVRFESDVESDVDWQVSGFRLSESFNEPFELSVELYTTDLWGEPAQMLGGNATLTLERGGLQREVSGIIERIEDGAIQQGKLVTRLTIVPALIALGMRKTSRIFQEMTIVEILQEVLDEGLAPYERSVDTGYLSGSYSAQEYTVQYRETDLQFVHRLMEEYGISYRFKSEDGKEIMVLGDSDGAWVDLVSLGNEAGVLPVNLRDGGSGGREDVRKFQRTSKLRSTVTRTVVFDWKAPDALIDAENSKVVDVGIPNGAEIKSEREEYDHDEPSTTYGYRTEGLVLADLETQVALRRALHQRDGIRCMGSSGATQMAPGCKFELLDHPQADLGAEYLVTEVIHSYGSYAGGEPGTDAFVNQFECIPAAVEWRPARRHPRPRVASMQTATVVGPAGEEIHTDEHGRIKVQFHWDRGGAFDENSSCFVRVVQPWAGNGWGFVWLPRIGMEVAVTFVDGDLDRPIVTGCLYNGSHPTPYPLPDEKTKSTIKSESSPGGGGFNELRFEDAAGSEEIYIHAQKDFNEVVLNDHNTTVGNNQTNNVDVDQTQTVHGNQSETVDGNQDMTVGGNRTVHVVGDFEETIDATETRTVTGAVTETFSASETRNISADQSETIGGSVTRTITGGVTETVTGALSQTINGGVSCTTPATYEVTAAAGITMTAAAGIKMVAPGGFTVVAPGGTTTVDSFFDKHGGKSADAFAFKLSISGMKVDICAGLALGVANNKLDLVNLKVDIAAAACKAGRQATVDSLGMALQQGYVNLHLFGLISLV
ncbi:type VI secretion system Vgr family protein [Nannocystaceae bacterium ST9]